MDPMLQIFPEIHDMVFQHFNANVFKKIILVSPFWNETVVKSQTMMRKVKLVVGRSKRDGNLTRELYRDFKKIENTIGFSSRRYQNVFVNGFVPPLTLNRVPKTLKHLVTLSSTLMELEIIYFDEFGVESEEIFKDIDLHRLKVLKLFMNDSTLINILLGGCRSLESLEIGGAPSELDSVRVEAFPCLHSFLKQNRKLKKIKLEDEKYWRLFFEEDISDIAEFQLKDLHVFDVIATRIPENVELNIVKFVAKQVLSLEHLSIVAYRRNVIEYVFNNMPALTSLRIAWNFEAENLNLNRNDKITDLKIDNARFEDLRRMIRATPKLSKLYVEELTQEKIDFIKNNLSELQTLQHHFPGRSERKPIWTDLWPNAVERKISDHFFINVKSIERVSN